MTEVTTQEFETNFDEYLDRIEAGEVFKIIQPDGTAVMAVPADPSLMDIEDLYTDHNEAS
jgi:antitoxin (DNA-binding transcriptional repressor) of toxin-antitoxin stability system